MRILVAIACLSLLGGCRCCPKPRPKVERCLKVNLTERAPYVKPPDIAAEMMWKW